MTNKQQKKAEKKKPVVRKRMTSTFSSDTLVDEEEQMHKLEEKLIPQPEQPEFVFEKAKSGIQKCKHCKNTIEKGEMRLLHYVKGHKNHTTIVYTHLTCIDVKLLDEIKAKDEVIENVAGSKFLDEEQKAFLMQIC